MLALIVLTIIVALIGIGQILYRDIQANNNREDALKYLKELCESIPPFENSKGEKCFTLHFSESDGCLLLYRVEKEGETFAKCIHGQFHLNLEDKTFFNEKARTLEGRKPRKLEELRKEIADLFLTAPVYICDRAA